MRAVAPRSTSCAARRRPSLGRFLALRLAAQERAAVGRGDEADELEPAARREGVRAEGHVAAAAEGGEERALGRDRARGRLVVQGRHRRRARPRRRRGTRGRSPPARARARRPAGRAPPSPPPRGRAASRPAIASRIASKRPSRRRRMRVSTLPRRSLEHQVGAHRGDERAAGAGSSCRRAPPPAAPRGARPPDRSASRGSARSRIAQSASPAGSTVGTSFSECTARSTSPASIASSISLRKAPLPPTVSSRRSRTRSPVVVMTPISTSWPSASSRALHVVRLPEGERAAAGADADPAHRPKSFRMRPTCSALAVAGHLLELHGRRVEELVDDRARSRPRGRSPARA